MEELGRLLGFDGKKRRIRCFGHIINLCAGSFIFGKDVSAFENLLGSDKADAITKHKAWQKRGPIGKLATLVVSIHWADSLRMSLFEKQQAAFDQSDDPRIQAQRPLGVVIYVATRWLSMLYVIRRALKLRPYIMELWEEQNNHWRRESRKSKKKESEWPLVFRDEMELSDDDWKMITVTGEVLEDIEDALLMLEGDGKTRLRKNGFVETFGSIWDYLIAFEFLMDRLETWKSLAEQYPNPEHFAVNINLAWDKLNGYYKGLDDTPVYYASIALHPAYRWAFFDSEWDRTDWVVTAKKLVQDVWEEEYKVREVERTAFEGPAVKRRKLFRSKLGSYREQKRTRPSESSAPSASSQHTNNQSQDLSDEYQRWEKDRQPTDEDVEDPLQYWHERRRVYPRLAQMALDFLSVAAMSADVERLFSAAGRMVTDERSSLDAMTISVCQSLRSWVQQGVIQLAPENIAMFPLRDIETSLRESQEQTGYIRGSSLGLSPLEVRRDEDGRVVCGIKGTSLP